MSKSTESFTPTAEELAVIKARRELRDIATTLTEEEKLALLSGRELDLDEIKPEMSRAKVEQARQAIFTAARALYEEQTRPS
jgi:hypothetical protein